MHIVVPWCSGSASCLIIINQFDSSMGYNENAIDEEGNGKPRYEIRFPRKDSEQFIWFLLRSKAALSTLKFCNQDKFK